MSEFFLNFILLAGFALIVYGVYQVSVPWACIVAGGGIIAAAILSVIVGEYNSKRK